MATRTRVLLTGQNFARRSVLSHLPRALIILKSSRGWQATPVASTSYNSTPAGGTYPTAGASTSTTSGWPNPGAAPYAPQAPSGTGYRPPTFGPGSVAGAAGTSHATGGVYNGASISTSYRPPGASSSYAQSGAGSSAGAAAAAAAGPAKSAVAFHLKSTPFYHIRKFVGVPAKIPRECASSRSVEIVNCEESAHTPLEHPSVLVPAHACNTKGHHMNARRRFSNSC